MINGLETQGKWKVQLTVAINSLSYTSSEFAFDSVDLLHYKKHKISLNRGRSYIDSPEWLKNKKATINPKNNDEKCFQYAIKVVLNHKNIVKDPQRI